MLSFTNTVYILDTSSLSVIGLAKFSPSLWLENGNSLMNVFWRAVVNLMRSRGGGQCPHDRVSVSIRGDTWLATSLHRKRLAGTQWVRRRLPASQVEKRHQRRPMLAPWSQTSGTVRNPFLVFMVLRVTLWYFVRQPLLTKWKWKVFLSCVWLFATSGTVAHQAPLSMGFSRQEDWSGLPFPPPGHHPDPGIKPGSPALQAISLPSEPPRKAKKC